MNVRSIGGTRIMRSMACIVVGIVLVLNAAGCSDGSRNAASGSDGIPGARVGVMYTVGESEAIQHWNKTAVTSLEEMGVEVVAGDGQGDPQVWATVLDSFRTQQVDAILTVGGFTPTTVTPQLRAIKNAGIPIVATGNPNADPEGLLTAQYAPTDAMLGRTLAQYLVGVLPPGSEYVNLNVPSSQTATDFIDASDAVLRAAGMKNAGTANMDPSKGSYPSQAGEGATNLLRANPTVKAVVSCCDFTPAATVPALRNSGFTDVIHGARYDNKSTLQLISTGAPVVVSAVNNDTGVLTGVEQILRYLNDGTPPDPDLGTDDIFTFDVIDAENVPPAGQYFFSPDEQINSALSRWKSEFNS